MSSNAASSGPPAFGQAGHGQWIVTSEQRQHRIQAACLETIALTEAARAPERDLAALTQAHQQLILAQQTLENELANLQVAGHETTHLWWQAAELETLIYQLQLALKSPVD